MGSGTSGPFLFCSNDGAGNPIRFYPDRDYTFSFTTGADSVKPVISSVAVASTSTTATITWTTNEPATSEVIYGLSSDKLVNTVNDPNLIAKHTITLSGLTPDTKYVYQINSSDAAGNTVNYSRARRYDSRYRYGVLAELSFFTVGFRNIQISSVTETSATITWNTYKGDAFETDSFVEYGTTTTYGNLEGNSTLSSSHLVELVNLSPGATYHFRIKATTPEGTSYSQDLTFKTAGGPPSTPTVQTQEATPSGGGVSETKGLGQETVLGSRTEQAPTVMVASAKVGGVAVAILALLGLMFSSLRGLSPIADAVKKVLTSLRRIT